VVDLFCAWYDPAYYLESIGWTLYDWQKWVLREAGSSVMLVAARQVGKTWLAAGKARHKQVSVAKSVTPVVCPNQDKSKILIKRVKEVAAKDLRHKLWDVDNSEELTEYGASIKGLPGTLGGVVGLTAPLLMMDESGLITSQLYQAATPMQAHVDNPELWIMTSAWYKQGWFWDAWDTGPCMDRDGTGFVKVLVRPPYDIDDGKLIDLPDPDRYVREWMDKGVHAFFSNTPTPEYLEQEMSRHPEWAIRQQYFCEFQPIEDAALPPEIVARAWSSEPGRKIGVGDSYISTNEGRRIGG
jgi:hypothetical protein